MKKEDEFEQKGTVFYGPVTFNGPMFDIHDNHHVENHVHYATDECRVLNNNEQKVKNAIEQLLIATDTKGVRIFTEQAQWYAVYKVLNELEGYPNQKKAFCMAMEELGMKNVTPAINYESIKKVQLPPVFETSKVTLWKNYFQSAEGAPRKQIIVALKLMSLLNAQ